MKFDDYQEKIEQIMKLIDRANTGSPEELAQKLNISERTVRRIIEKLKSKNRDIAFCRKAKSYIQKN